MCNAFFVFNHITKNRMKNIDRFKKQINDDIGESIEKAYLLFVIFSRFEFALKAIGCTQEKSEEAKASWQKFGIENDNKFQQLLADEKNIHLKTAASYLFGSPPQILKVDNKKLNFKPREKAKKENLEELLMIILVIRNNLFHGSKSLNIPEASRDEKLLLNSLSVLDECLNLNQDLKNKFFEQID